MHHSGDSAAAALHCAAGALLSAGVKAGRMSVSGPADLSQPGAAPDEAELAPLRAALGAHLPGVAAGQLLRSSACIFTMTPDSHFVIDTHPRAPQARCTVQRRAGGASGATALLHHTA